MIRSSDIIALFIALLFLFIFHNLDYRSLDNELAEWMGVCSPSKPIYDEHKLTYVCYPK